MPSFATLLAAFGLLSASAFAQSNLGSVEADLVARDDLTGEGLFARSGDLQARHWSKTHENFGAKCKHSGQCWTNVHMSKAFCDHTHHCNFHCLGDTMKQTGGKEGNHCIGKYEAKKCHFHHMCKTNVENAWGYCNSGKCAWKCAPGFHSKGNSCTKNVEVKSCDGKHKCPTVEGGYTSCSAKKCVQHCDSHLGYKLYTNSHKTAYKCINTQNDKNNCGKPGKVCPYGYHHKGEPFCYDGECHLNCHGYEERYTKSGIPYCSTKKTSY